MFRVKQNLELFSQEGEGSISFSGRVVQKVVGKYNHSKTHRNRTDLLTKQVKAGIFYFFFFLFCDIFCLVSW